MDFRNPLRGAARTWLVTAAILTHGCQAYVFQAFNFDKVAQSAAGQCWLDGRGFVVPIVTADHHAAYAPVRQWPPGYSVVYAAAIATTRDPFLAGFLIDLIAAIVFFIAWARLVNLAGDPHAAAIVLAYWAFAVSPITRLPSSDALALAAYSFAMAAMTIAARGRALTWSAVAGVAAGAACAVRFAYWPLAWIPLAPLLWANRRERRGWLAAAAYFAAFVPPVAWAAVTNLSTVSAPSQLIPNAAVSGGPYWRQMLPVPPVGATALGVDDAWRRMAVSLPSLRPWLWAAFWAVTLVALVITVAAARRAAADRSADPGPRTLATWGVLTFAATAALISTLTVQIVAYPDGWTYMTDAPRYLAPVYPYVLLAIAAVGAGRGRWRAVAAALLIVCGVSVVAFRVGQMGMYVTRNAAASPSGTRARGEMAAVFNAVRSFPRAGVPPTYCDTDAFRRSIATMAGAAASASCDSVAAPAMRARVDDSGALVAIVTR